MADTFGQDDVRALPDETLEEINRLWTVVKVFSNTAHDVNNALHVISGSAELLMARGDLDEVLARRLTAIGSQAHRAADLLGGLGSYVRGANDAFSVVDLATLVGRATAMRTASLARAEIAVAMEHVPDGPCLVAVQPQKALQLLLNLFFMAEEAFASGVTGRIDMRLDRHPDGVDLTLVPRATGGEPRVSSPARVGPGAPMFAELLRWSAHRIAASQRGGLTTALADQRIARITLKLPAAS